MWWCGGEDPRNDVLDGGADCPHGNGQFLGEILRHKITYMYRESAALAIQHSSDAASFQISLLWDFLCLLLFSLGLVFLFLLRRSLA